MIDTVKEYSPEQKIHWSHYIKYVNITILQALLYKCQIVQYAININLTCTTTYCVSCKEIRAFWTA